MFNDPKEKSADLIEWFGIAIKAVDANQRHVGMLYKKGAETRLCHLVFHHVLRDQPVSDAYHWAEAGLDQTNRKFLALQCARMAGMPQRIPYGLAVQDICFDKEGRYIPQAPGSGLTCATFITAFLRAFAFHLLEEGSWPNRDEDKIWQERIIDHMERDGNTSQEHLEGMKKDIGARRYRPEEVAGAVPCSEYPVGFAEAIKLAEAILAMLYVNDQKQ